MGLGPFDPTGPPGSVKPNRLGSGSVNRPSPAPSLSSLSPRALWRNLDRRRRRPVTPAISGGLRRRCLGQNGRLHSLYQLLQLESTRTSSPRRSRWFPPQDPPPSNISDKVPHRAFFSELAEPPLVLVLREYSPVEAPWCGAPSACLVKTSSGSLWLATQALPAMPSRRAPG
jgi:hypothetical protein